jgi:hypothetical protein
MSIEPIITVYVGTLLRGGGVTLPPGLSWRRPRWAASWRRRG